MTNSGCVDWLLVGTGDIVRKRVASALSGSECGRLVGICGGYDRARAIAQKYQLKEVYGDLNEALKHTSASAVYIATPVYRHAEEAIKALAAGKNVLIEKPLGLNGPDAQRIVEAARGTKLRAGCAYYRRCLPRFAHLKEAIENKRLGRIVLVRICYYSWFQPEKKDTKLWRAQKARSGGGPLADMGSHMLDLLVGLFGLPRSVFAKTDTIVHEYEVEDSAAIVMTLNNDAQVVASFGWNSKTWRHEFEVVGTEGRVEWSPADTGKIVFTVGRDVQELDLPNAENVHQPLVDDFNQAIIAGRDPIVPVAEAAKVNIMLDAIYASAESGQEVNI